MAGEDRTVVNIESVFERLIGEVSDIEDHAGAHEFTQQFDPALAQRAVGACAAGIVAAAVVNGPDCA